jgi:hypothetical protein
VVPVRRGDLGTPGLLVTRPRVHTICDDPLEVPLACNTTFADIDLLADQVTARMLPVICTGKYPVTL